MGSFSANLRRPGWLLLVLLVAASGIKLGLRKPVAALSAAQRNQLAAVAVAETDENSTAVAPEPATDIVPAPVALPPAITYTNYHASRVPWSIHVVRLDRAASGYEIHTVHAGRSVLGLGTLSDQLELIRPDLGKPVAAVNGDFYQRNGRFVGHPRGVQIVEGEVISAPNGGASFWIDDAGQPHLTNVTSHFEILWPDGTQTLCGLNEERRGNRVELYTPALGRSTGTAGGCELVLEPEGTGPWLPLRIGETYTARVRQVRATGNTPLRSDTMVVSLPQTFVQGNPKVPAGAIVKISTETIPSLRGAMTAIGGGPALLHNGKVQPIHPATLASYQGSSMLERHPRAALGWNQKYYFLVEVDGRQWNLSIGMTLNELALFMLKLGCDEALNFDGGGSAALWYDGQVQNSPCDGHERDIANSLVVVRKNPATQTGNHNAQFNSGK